MTTLDPAAAEPATSDLAATLDRGSRNDSTPRPAAKVALLTGSTNGMRQETQRVLATRLRAAAVVLFFAATLFWLWRIVEMGWTEYHTLRVAKLHVIANVCLGAAALLMCTRCPSNLRWLRLWELEIFGVPALFLLLDQHDAMAYCCQHNNRFELIEMTWGLVTAWFTLIFTYSLFIPNSWRRAALVLAAMAAAPIVMVLIGRSEDPMLAEWLDWREVGRMALPLLVAWLVGTAGVRHMGLLRREAFEARKLGQYYLKQQIGRGGMGEVFLAEHQLLKRPCAIKVIRPSEAANPRALARFEREVRSAARLSHWNSIEIFDYGQTEDGTFYYVMEYLPGLDLGALVERFGPLPPERVIHFLTQTCDALREAHTLGLVHRDIKPGNLFAAQRGGVYDVAKLLDFGLVKELLLDGPLNVTQEGGVTGSPLYMSPEQALGETPDERSDIYSLGAVAYFLLTGRPPFERDTAMKVLFAHAHETPEPISRLRTGVPDDLERIVLRCLAKRREERFASVAEFKQALAACDLAGVWSEARAAAWWRRVTPAEQVATTTDSVELVSGLAATQG